MSKILYFSSVHEDAFIDKTLNKIKKDLTKPSISTKKLYHIQHELNELNLYLMENVRHQARITQSALTTFLQQQTELSTLTYNCHNLFIDKRVDTITQQAQKIVKDSQERCKNTSRRIARLKKDISALSYYDALSLENRQMIHLANYYLTTTEQVDLSRDVSALRLSLKEENAKKDLHEVFDLSVSLYEIAGYLYNDHIREALELFYTLSPWIQKDIKDKLQEHHIDLHKLDQTSHIATLKHNLYLVMQICLGYSHYILYQSFECPTFEDIDLLFQDLDRVLKQESAI